MEEINTKNYRVELLDYFRGIMAFSVLIYHYTFWSEMPLIYPIDQTVSRLGVYAVSAFYVLSGASLALVYYKKSVNVDFIKDFTVKRFFRIAPLFYLVTTAAIVLAVMSNYLTTDTSVIPDIKTIILNYTLTFGWLSPDSYIATGAWSIGSELVFYSLFPIMLFLIKKSYKHFFVFALIAITLSFSFSEIFINSDKSFESQWSLYINPLNQLYLFVGGFLVGYLYKMGKEVNRAVLLILMVSAVCVFVFFPTEGSNRLSFVVGYNKIIFSVTIFIFCLFATFWGNIKQNVITRVLKFFGDISYSLYLIHPLVWGVTGFALQIVSISNPIIRVVLSILVTIFISAFVYNYLEKPFIKIGRRVSDNLVGSRPSSDARKLN